MSKRQPICEIDPQSTGPETKIGEIMMDDNGISLRFYSREGELCFWLSYEEIDLQSVEERIKKLLNQLAQVYKEE